MSYRGGRGRKSEREIFTSENVGPSALSIYNSNNRYMYHAKNISGALVFAVLYLLATFFFSFFFLFRVDARSARSRWWRRQICIRAVRLNRAISRALHRNNTDRGREGMNYSIEYLWLRDIIAVLPPESTEMRYFMRHCADQTIQSMELPMVAHVAHKQELVFIIFSFKLPAPWHDVKKLSNNCPVTIRILCQTSYMYTHYHRYRISIQRRPAKRINVR